MFSAPTELSSSLLRGEWAPGNMAEGSCYSSALGQAHSLRLWEREQFPLLPYSKAGSEPREKAMSPTESGPRVPGRAYPTSNSAVSWVPHPHRDDTGRQSPAPRPWLPPPFVRNRKLGPRSARLHPLHQIFILESRSEP